MATVAIICEYNLLHNGHLRLFSEIRRLFGRDTCILSLMSGNFTQRGLIAATDKYTRAAAAMACGSDLVLELPLPYSLGVGQRFATGAISLLNAIGGIDYLVFGSECADLPLLAEAAHNRSSEEFANALSQELSSAGVHESYIRTSERVYASLYGKLALKPNDMLGVEYLKALTAQGSGICPLAIQRTGEETATEARRLFLAGEFAKLSALVPQSALALYRTSQCARESALDKAILYRLRTAEPEHLTQYAEMSYDLSYRIVRAALEAAGLEDFYNRCATKKYTRARIRRAVMCSMLKITAADFLAPPTYTVLLSASNRGRALLRELRKVSQIPVYTKASDAADELGRRAEALYTLALDRPQDAGAMFRKSPAIEK